MCGAAPGSDVATHELLRECDTCVRGSHPCEKPHAKPGPESEAACLPSFEPYVGRDYETSELYVTTFEPTPESWGQGDRGILCVVSTFEAETPLTGSVRESGR